jgi:hypothetical protein
MQEAIIYTVPMALQDFMPVILSATGLFFLARFAFGIRHDLGRMSVVGATLVLLGGLSKAIWKLVVAATDGATDIKVLDNSLFWLLGAGFTVTAYAMSYALRIANGKMLRRDNIALLPVIVVALFYAIAIAFVFAQPEKRAWSFVLLGMTTLGNLVLSALVIVYCLKRKQTLIALLFLMNIVLIFALSGLARSSASRTFVLQWTEQIINTLSSAAFAFAAYKFSLLTKIQEQKVNDKHASIVAHPSSFIK